MKSFVSVNETVALFETMRSKFFMSIQKPLCAVLTLDKNSAASFTLSGLKYIFDIVYYDDIHLKVIKEAYRNDHIVIEGEFLLSFLKKYKLSWEECILDPTKTIILDLDDNYKTLLLDEGKLSDLVTKVRCYIKREPSYRHWNKHGINTDRLVPTIFGFSKPTRFNWDKYLGGKAFLVGTLTNHIRLDWGSYLKQNLNDDFLFHLFAEKGSLPDEVNVDYNDLLKNNHVLPLKNKLSQTQYFSRITDANISVCLSGLGPLTERHLEAWWSGRVVVSDDSILSINFPGLDIDPDNNSLIAKNKEEMLIHILNIKNDRNTAKKIAKNGTTMIRDAYSPRKWAELNSDVILGK